MIRKLRMKMIAASMVSLFVVLLVIETIVAGLNYQKIVADAEMILTVLEENGGRFPENDPRKIENAGSEKPEMGAPGKEGEMSPELPYESRFFSVVLNEKDEVSTVDTGKIASIDTASAIQYAQTVLADEKEAGFMDDYRYRVCHSETGTQIIFLDRGRELSNFRNLIVTGIVVSILGLLAVFVSVIFLSASMIRPFLKNEEKQKRFITDAGHELKTPLAIIDADTEVLAMDMGENEWITDIQMQSKRLAELTNHLILLSRMEEEQRNRQTAEIALSDVVEETVENFQALAVTQKKTLSKEIMPRISFRGEEAEIRRLVTILLDNAMKYSEENGKIQVTLQKQKKKIYLTVFNTTEFIAKEHLAHLFDRFYRTDQSRNSDTGGYGLGLSIAAAITEAYKGNISAYTEDEKSLRITIVFPEKIG